jgi:tetratricopeptide (TPR) repeat protein
LKTDTEPQVRKARLDAIGHDLEEFWTRAKEVAATQKSGADAGLQELEAKATLLQAVYLSLRGDAGDEQVAQSLADFGQRFPQQQALLPQAVRLRLGALLQLGRFGDAEEAVQQNAAALASENRSDALDSLAASFAKAGTRRKTEGDSASAAAAAGVALALYAVLDGTGTSADTRQQLAVARLHETTNDWDAAAAIYQEVLQTDGSSFVALRGLAHAEEKRGKNAAALRHWTAYTEKVRPGDPAWYQGQYEQARLMLAGGDKQRSCALLTTLRPSMPGLGDATLRGQLNELYQQACA